MVHDVRGMNERERLDLLISRIADGEAGEDDWKSFGALAEHEAGAWKELAQAQLAHGAMSLAVSVALHAADRVELPSQQAAAIWSRGTEPPARLRTWSRMGAFGGWVAAAAVALAWAGGFGSGGRQTIVPTNTAGVFDPAAFTINTSDDAVKAYLDVGGKTGRVIGELPNRVLVDSQPAMLEGGRRGVEVVYVRQFIERALVSDVARMGLDETGRRVPVPMTVPSAWSGPQ